jgi:hypothetical protein
VNHASDHTGPVKKDIALLYGFSVFDQFMIVIALWVPYLATKGIGMRQFMGPPWYGTPRHGSCSSKFLLQGGTST